MNFITPILIVGIIGLLAGVVLAVASILLAVPKDETAEALEEILPGANCGACGCAGCADYAKSIVEDGNAVNKCTPGGAACAAKVAEIMGVDAGSSTPMKAVVACSGTCDKTGKKYEFQGIQSCQAVKGLYGGDGMCKFGCLGYGDCTRACAFDAIHVDPENHVAVVDPNKCKACGKCIATCPRGIISLVPADPHVSILCSSKRKGVFVRQVCDIGCLGCGICEKTCPEGAITVEQFLARIDYDKCVHCEKCEEKCPRHLIR